MLWRLVSNPIGVESGGLRLEAETLLNLVKENRIKHKGYAFITSDLGLERSLFDLVLIG